MKSIGITGGIGSGKSSLLAVFEAENIPVFKADNVAKNLLNTNLKPFIEKHFGVALYSGGDLDRKALATIVFKDKKKLELLNELVHPAVALAFEQFKAAHPEASLVVKEAAILFESRAANQCDYTILITAPENERIKRVMQRDNINLEAVKARMANQWSDEKKIPLSDFVIENKDLLAAKAELKNVLKKIKSS